MGHGACELERWGQDQAHLSIVISIYTDSLFQKCGREILALQGSNEGKSSCSPIPERLKQCQQQKEHPCFSSPEASAAGIRCSKEEKTSSLPFLRCSSRRDLSNFNCSISYMGLSLLFHSWHVTLSMGIQLTDV